MLVTMEKILEDVPVKNVLPVYDFMGVSVGDEVNAADGSYEKDNKAYVVNGGKLEHIWYNVEGQLEMIFEGIC